MFEVDGWNDEGHERIAAVVFSIGENAEVGFEELDLYVEPIGWFLCSELEVLRTNVACNITVQPREDYIAIKKLFCFAFFHL
jgi:hypothetical protein